MSRLFFALAFALFIVPLGLACSGSDDEAEPLRLHIGVVQSDTGVADVYGKAAVNGIKLAIQELQTDDFVIDYTVVDDKSTVDGGTAAFTSLTRQGVDAVIGPTLSGVALEVHKISQAAGVPAIGATTTGEGITETGSFVFRTALSEARVVPPVIEYVHARSPIGAAVLIVDSSDGFSLTSAVAMKQGIQVIGATVVAEIDVAGAADVDSRLAELRDGEDFDVFLLTPLVEKSALVMRTIRSLGFDQQFIGGNGLNTLDIIAASGGSVDGAFVGAAWNPAVPSTMSERFVADYTAQYGSAPDLYAAQGYVAVQVLAAAAKQAGTTEAEALRAALGAVNVETVFGTISMSAGREAQYDPVIQQFQGQQLVVVE